MLDRRQVMTGIALSGAFAARPALAQQKSEISVSRQPGILYMPTHVIEKQQLIEKHAAKLGITGLKVNWVDFNNGGAQQDALLSGNVDMINTGTGNLLLLWDRTKGGIKGVVASSAAPLVFVSRDPKIKSLKDLGPGDKIAVPTVKVSTQAILLQMAAIKMYGADDWQHFDPMTVQMGHPDAFIALKNETHEVKNHFAAPPFQFYELKSVPGAHAVVNSADIIGGPLTQGQFFTSTKFAEANPTIINGGACRRRGSQGCHRDDDPRGCGNLPRRDQRQDAGRRYTGGSQGARHDGMEPLSAGHHEIRRTLEQDRDIENAPGFVEGLLLAGGA